MSGKTMCIQNAIQQKIAELTNNGETIAVFLVETVHGHADRDINMHHRVEAARLISKYGIPQPDNITHPSRTPFHPFVLSLSKDAKRTRTKTPHLHDIIAYPLARYIRERTNDGETLVRSLTEIMEGDKYRSFEFTDARTQTIQDRHRVAAARELLRHALGESKPRRRRRRRNHFHRQARSA